MPKQQNYTAGYDRADQDDEPEITFASAFGGEKLPGVLTQPERGYRYTATGLDFRRKLTREEYRDGLLPELQVMETARQLIIGDAYLHGIENGHIESYEDMAELTGYQPLSIENYASICRNVPQFMRINSLTFSHYQQIASLPEEERPHWISFAAGSGLSYRALKALIEDVGAKAQLPAPADDTGNTPEDEPEEPASPAPVNTQVVILDSPIKDKVHRERMNYIWKKVEKEEPMTDEDLGDVWMLRKWCDMLIERSRKQK